LKALEHFGQELELLNTAAKERRRSAQEWLRGCSGDGKNITEFEFRRGVDDLRVNEFVNNPYLYQSVFRSLAPQGADKVDLGSM
jgi:hypothetical protein